MSSYKKQHYVPQSYLKAWSNDGRRIWMFDKNMRQGRYVGINSVAQESYFNDSFRRLNGQITDGESPDLFERQFQLWENQFLTSREVAHDVAANKRGGSLKERKTMALCAALQLLRTAKFRQALIKEVNETMGDKSFPSGRISDWIKEPLRSRVLKDTHFVKEHIALIQTHLIWSTQLVVHIATDLYYYIWVIAKNSTPFPFYTSDAPLSPLIHRKGTPPFYPTPRCYTEDKNELPLLKQLFCSEPVEQGLEIVFPVSPACAILMFHPFDFQNELADKQGKVLVVGYETVSLRNIIIANSAVRQVFSSNNGFEIANLICSKASNLS